MYLQCYHLPATVVCKRLSEPSMHSGENDIFEEVYHGNMNHTDMVSSLWLLFFGLMGSATGKQKQNKHFEIMGIYKNDVFFFNKTKAFSSVPTNTCEIDAQ